MKDIQKKLGIVGNSRQIKEILKTVISVAETDIPVLILGESGSGKEVIASAINKLSRRRNKELVSVNCGAIPEGLIESELFGHEKGAFTGAVSSKKGYFELADKGTIFLDEVGELPLQTQVKLLRVLETGVFMRVGGTQYTTVDVRLIAATNRRLEEMVEEQSFRMDLYYRLKGVQIQLPPLRTRVEDIEPLARYFMEQYAANHDIPIVEFSPEALNLLREYHWPGNVRELKNVVETVFVLSKGETVTAELLREHLNFRAAGDEPLHASALPVVTHKTVEQAERELIYRAIVSMGVEIGEMKKLMTSFLQHWDSRLSGMVRPVSEPEDDEDIVSLEEMERRAIESALRRLHGNRKKVAEKLKISERTLYRKIKEYGLEED